MILDKISCTPSCSRGNIEVQREGFAENQTALANVQWKNKWASFSCMLQTEQNLLIFVERLPALSPVARAFLISLQQKVLIHGGSYLCFHALFRINNACCVTLLVPLCGFCTCTSELRNLYTSLVEHTSFFAGFHRTISLLLDGTV